MKSPRIRASLVRHLRPQVLNGHRATHRKNTSSETRKKMRCVPIRAVNDFCAAECSPWRLDNIRMGLMLLMGDCSDGGVCFERESRRIPLQKVFKDFGNEPVRPH